MPRELCFVLWMNETAKVRHRMEWTLVVILVVEGVRQPVSHSITTKAVYKLCPRTLWISFRWLFLLPSNPLPWPHGSFGNITPPTAASQYGECRLIHCILRIKTHPPNECEQSRALILRGFFSSSNSNNNILWMNTRLCWCRWVVGCLLQNTEPRLNNKSMHRLYYYRLRPRDIE